MLIPKPYANPGAAAAVAVALGSALLLGAIAVGSYRLVVGEPVRLSRLPIATATNLILAGALLRSSTGRKQGP